MAHILTRNQHHSHLTYAKTDWSAIIWPGLISGAVFMMMQMVSVMLVQGQSPWASPRMNAAMALRRCVASAG